MLVAFLIVASECLGSHKATHEIYVFKSQENKNGSEEKSGEENLKKSNTRKVSVQVQKVRVIHLKRIPFR